MLWRKAYRDLRAMGLRAVLIVIVIGAGPGTAAGIALAMHDVEATRDTFYSRYALADLDLRLRAPLPSERLRRRAAEARAQRAETRLILDGAALHGGSRTAAEVVGMPVDASLNRLAVTAGRGLDGGDPRGAALDAEYADRVGIGPGDRLRLQLAGRAFSLRVRGLVRSPEYLLATANPDYLVPQRGSLAAVFLPRASLQRLTGLEGRANDLAVDLPGGGDGALAKRLAAGLPTARVTPRSRQYGRRLTEADIHSFSIFAPVMGVVFGIVGLLLIALSLRRLVSSQRRELGALLAIGYPPRAVVGSVMLLATALAVLGAALAIGATLGVGRLVADQYSSAVGFPETRYPLAFGPLALAVGLALAATLLAALLPAYRLARLDPIEALRGEGVGAFELPDWLQRLTALGPPALTYGLRGLLRRPLLSAATVISIAGAVGLGAALNILVSSTNSSVDAAFAGQGWTHSADLARPLPNGRAAALARQAGAARAEATVKGPAELRAGGRAVGAQLTGLPRRPALLRLDVTSGEGPGPGRIVLSEQTADKLGVGPADTVALRTPERVATVRVAGIARTLATEQAYLPRAEAARLLGLGGRATSVLIAGAAADARRLRDNPAVARVTSKASALAAERELLDELTGLISVLQAISLGVGALFLVSTLALSYLDRRGEFATLAALGYGRRQIGAAVAGEALTQTLLAAALSIPLGILIASPLSQRIAEAWFEIGLHPEAPSFLLVIVPALALALLAAAHATRRALRLNIAATVRGRLIG
ncbi:MAG TPA: ABC transporter permease [Solirubrobacterales bacterium]|nr:ABC transporter permease [Solirubrobacterales bacterium]